MPTRAECPEMVAGFSPARAGKPLQDPRHLAPLQGRVADHACLVHRPEDRAIVDLGRFDPAPKLRTGLGGEPPHLADAGLIGLAPPDQGGTRTIRRALQIV